MTPPLPTELWTRIASLLDSHSLNTLSLVSHSLFDISRRAYDNELVLQHHDDMPEKHTPIEVINFLVQKNRAHHVRKIFLSVFYEDKKTCEQVMTKALSSFPKMQSLSISMAPSSLNTDIQKRLVLLLQTCCHFLEKFSFSGRHVLRYGDFSIRNIKMVQWNDFGKISLAFTSLCRASLTTLQEIELTSYAPATQIFSYLEFFQLLFPSLIALKIGPGPPTLEEQDRGVLADAFTTFLLAHSGIEKLRLLHACNVDGDDVYLPLTFNKASPEILPNLISLRAHPSQIEALVKAKALFFKSLRSLYITAISEVQDLKYEIKNMFRELVKFTDVHGPCNALRELVFTDLPEPITSSITETFDFEDQMEQASDIFPEIELWRGRVPFYENRHMFADIFCRFSSLRVVVIDNFTVVTPTHAVIIAEECWSFEKLVWVSDDTVFVTSRGDDDEIMVQERDQHPDETKYHSDDQELESDLGEGTSDEEDSESDEGDDDDDDGNDGGSGSQEGDDWTDDEAAADTEDL